MIKIIVLIWFGISSTVIMANADPKPIGKMEKKKPMSLDQILKKAEVNNCYQAIILPTVIDDRMGPSGEIEAGAPDFTVITRSEIPKFFELLKKRKCCNGLELGFQYQLSFLMEAAPTSPAMNLMFRKCGEVWFLAYAEEKFEMEEEFSRWMNERMLKIK
jgi:hypothetical protein